MYVRGVPPAVKLLTVLLFALPMISGRPINQIRGPDYANHIKAHIRAVYHSIRRGHEHADRIRTLSGTLRGHDPTDHVRELDHIPPKGVPADHQPLPLPLPEASPVEDHGGSRELHDVSLHTEDPEGVVPSFTKRPPQDRLGVRLFDNQFYEPDKEPKKPIDFGNNADEVSEKARRILLKNRKGTLPSDGTNMYPFHFDPYYTRLPPKLKARVRAVLRIKENTTRRLSLSTRTGETAGWYYRRSPIKFVKPSVLKNAISFQKIKPSLSEIYGQGVWDFLREHNYDTKLQRALITSTTGLVKADMGEVDGMNGQVLLESIYQHFLKSKGEDSGEVTLPGGDRDSHAIAEGEPVAPAPPTAEEITKAKAGHNSDPASFFLREE